MLNSLALVGFERPRGGNMHLGDTKALVHFPAILQKNLVEHIEPVVLDEHCDEVSHLLPHPQPLIQLVENGDFLVVRERRVEKNLAQVGAFAPCGHKIVQLPLNILSLQMRLKNHVSKSAGVGSGNAGHQFFPPLVCVPARSAAKFCTRMRSASAPRWMRCRARSTARSAAKRFKSRCAAEPKASISCSADSIMRLRSSS